MDPSLAKGFLLIGVLFIGGGHAQESGDGVRESAERKADKKETGQQQSTRLQTLDKLYEAEGLFIINGDSFKMFATEKVLGYSGGGYLNFDDYPDSQVSLEVFGKGKKTLVFRYATIYENLRVDILEGKTNVLVAGLSLESTGGDWLEKSVVVETEKRLSVLYIVPLITEEDRKRTQVVEKATEGAVSPLDNPVDPDVSDEATNPFSASDPRLTGRSWGKPKEYFKTLSSQKCFLSVYHPIRMLMSFVISMGPIRSLSMSRNI